MPTIRVNRNTGNFLGANWRKNYFINRSFDRAATGWRGWARTAARAGAATTFALGSIIEKGVGHASSIYKRLRTRQGKVDKSKYKVYSTSKDMPKRRFFMPGGPSKRARVYDDPASYKQLTSVYSKSGRRVSGRTRAKKLWETITSGIKFRHARISDMSAPYGAIFLRHGPTSAAADVVYLPVHLFSLSNINQGAAADGNVNAGYASYYPQMGTGSGNIFWTAQQAFGTDGVTPRFSYEQITGESTASIGRKGLLDWTRVKLCIYGKSKQPSTVRLSLVKFLDEEFTPEYNMNKASGVGAGITNKAVEFWQKRFKTLINGQVADKSRIPGSEIGMKVIKRWIFNVNPIDAGAETVNSDPRGHMKHVDIFNRWNRVVDFTLPSTTNIDTYAELNNANTCVVPESGYTAYPRRQETGLYLLLESITENQVAHDATAATMAETQVSIDFNVQCKYTHVTPFNTS